MGHKSWQVSTAEAYTVSCPACKSKAGFTCTYLPELISPQNPSLGWKPKSGQPTKRPHSERFDHFRKVERDRDRRRRDAERLEQQRELRLAWRFSIARSIRDGALRDTAELVAWLKEYADIFEIKEDTHG